MATVIGRPGHGLRRFVSARYHARMRAIIVIGLCLLSACESKKKEESQGRHSSGREDPPPDLTTNAQIIAAPLVAIDSTADGKPFSIQLPLGVLKKAEVNGAYSTWHVKQDWLTTPSFTVTASAMKMKDGETGDATPMGNDVSERVIARAEALDDGGYINLDERKDHAFFNLEVCRPSGEGRLCCSVMQRDKNPIASYAEMVAFAEKVCKTMMAR